MPLPLPPNPLLRVLLQPPLSSLLLRPCLSPPPPPSPLFSHFPRGIPPPFPFPLSPSLNPASNHRHPLPPPHLEPLYCQLQQSLMSRLSCSLPLSLSPIALSYAFPPAFFKLPPLLYYPVLPPSPLAPHPTWHPPLLEPLSKPPPPFTPPPHLEPLYCQLQQSLMSRLSCAFHCDHTS